MVSVASFAPNVICYIMREMSGQGHRHSKEGQAKAWKAAGSLSK